MRNRSATANPFLALPTFILVVMSYACGTATTLTPSSTVATTATAQTATKAPNATLTPAPTNDTDNLKLLFIKSNLLWLWHNGTALPITQSHPVEWYIPSEDGQIISFAVGDGVKREIWAVNIDGTEERQLMSVDDFNEIYKEPNGKELEDPWVAVVPAQIGWLPGTHTLAFTTQVVSPGPSPYLYNDLRLVDADTLTKAVVVGPGEAGTFSFSPDGSSVAIVQPTRVRLFDSDFKLVRDDALVYPETHFSCERHLVYPPVYWSPDSQYLLAFVPGGPESSCHLRSTQTIVWRVPAGSGEATQLADYAFDAAANWAYLPSPDRSHLAYIADLDLHLSQIDGRDDRVIFKFQAPIGRLGLERWLDETTVEVWLGEPAQRRVLDTETGQMTAFNAPPTGAWAWLEPDRFIYATKAEDRWEFRLGRLNMSDQLLFSLPVVNGEDRVSDLSIVRQPDIHVP